MRARRRLYGPVESAAQSWPRLARITPRHLALWLALWLAPWLALWLALWLAPWLALWLALWLARVALRIRAAPALSPQRAVVETQTFLDAAWEVMAINVTSRTPMRLSCETWCCSAAALSWSDEPQSAWPL